MSLWIRVICTQSIGQLEVADLRRGSGAADFVTWAENQGLSEAEGKHAQKALRFEGPAGALTTARLFYRPGEQFIGVERWTGAVAVEKLKALRVEFLGQPDATARRIDAVLSLAVELVAFELNADDAAGMGWPISWQTAMWLGNLGKGLIDANGSWWDPETYEVIRSSL